MGINVPVGGCRLEASNPFTKSFLEVSENRGWGPPKREK